MKKLGLLLQIFLPTSNMWEVLEQLVYYSYFQVNNHSYIFVYAKSKLLKAIVVNFLSTNCTIRKNIEAN